MARTGGGAAPRARHRAPDRARRRAGRRARASLAVPFLGLLVVVAPSGTTMAAWQDSATITVPTLRTDTPGITVTGRDDGTFVVTNTSARTLLDWSVASLRFDVAGLQPGGGVPGRGLEHKASLVKVSASGPGGPCSREVAKGTVRLGAGIELISSAPSPLAARAAEPVCLEVLNGSLQRWMAHHDVAVTMSVEAVSDPAGWSVGGTGTAAYGSDDGDAPATGWRWLWELVEAWVGDPAEAWQVFWADNGPQIGTSEATARREIAPEAPRTAGKADVPADGAEKAEVPAALADGTGMTNDEAPSAAAGR